MADGPGVSTRSRHRAQSMSVILAEDDDSRGSLTNDLIIDENEREGSDTEKAPDKESDSKKKGADESDEDFSTVRNRRRRRNIQAGNNERATERELSPNKKYTFPLVVRLSEEARSKTKNLSAAALQRAVTDAFKGTEVFRTTRGMDRLILGFHTAEDLNAARSQTVFLGKEVHCASPGSEKTQAGPSKPAKKDRLIGLGVAKIGTPNDLQEINEMLKPTYDGKVRALKMMTTPKKNGDGQNNVRSPNGKVLLEFLDQQTPAVVKIGMQVFRVTPFRGNPLQCFHCHAFGHVAAKCKSRPVCGHCSGGHTSTDCEIKDDKDKLAKRKCKNCGLPGHGPASKQCWEFRIFKTASQSAAEGKQTFDEAMKFYRPTMEEEARKALENPHVSDNDSQTHQKKVAPSANPALSSPELREVARTGKEKSPENRGVGTNLGGQVSPGSYSMVASGRVHSPERLSLFDAMDGSVSGVPRERHVPAGRGRGANWDTQAPQPSLHRRPGHNLTSGCPRPPSKHTNPAVTAELGAKVTKLDEVVNQLKELCANSSDIELVTSLMGVISNLAEAIAIAVSVTFSH